MKRSILISFVLLVTVAATRFLITLSIARHWPKGDVGTFNLVISISFLLSVFGLMGQNLGLVRLFSSEELGVFDWKGYLVKLCLKGAGIALAGSIAAGLIYKLGTMFVVSCFVLTTCVIVQEYCSSIFRARQRYYASLIVGQFMPVAFMAVLAFFLLSSVPSLNIMLSVYMAIGAGYSLLSIYLTFSLMPSGTAPIPAGTRRQGYILFGVAITFVMFNQADVMLVAGLINVESLAVYSVVLSLMKVYDFGGLALNHVLLPKMGAITSAQLKRLFVYLVTAGVLVTSAYLLLGGKAVQYLYKGRYDAGVVLIPLFCLAGVLKLLYTIPSSFISGVGSEPTMKSFLYVNIAAVVVNYVANIYLISVSGLVGAAIGTVIAWAMRVAGAYVLTGKSMFVPKQAAAAVEAQ